MNMNTLNELFMQKLRCTYEAERRLTKALPKLSKAAHPFGGYQPPPVSPS